MHLLRIISIVLLFITFSCDNQTALENNSSQPQLAERETPSINKDVLDDEELMDVLFRNGLKGEITELKSEQDLFIRSFIDENNTKVRILSNKFFGLYEQNHYKNQKTSFDLNPSSTIRFQKTYSLTSTINGSTVETDYDGSGATHDIGMTYYLSPPFSNDLDYKITRRVYKFNIAILQNSDFYLINAYFKYRIFFAPSNSTHYIKLSNSNSFAYNSTTWNNLSTTFLTSTYGPSDVGSYKTEDITSTVSDAVDANDTQLNLAVLAGSESGTSNKVHLMDYVNTYIVIGEHQHEPRAFNLTSPAHNYQSESKNITFNWAASSSNPVAKYNLYVDGVKKANLITGTSFTVNNLSIGNHNWYVEAVNSLGSITTSTRTVKIIEYAPKNFTLNSPNNGTVYLNTASKTFSWSTANAYPVATYDFYLNNTLVTNLSGTSYTIAAQAVGSYTWKVVAKNSKGTKSSETRNYEVKYPAPAAPSLTSPANGLSTTSNSVSFTWASVQNATSYLFEVSSNLNNTGAMEQHYTTNTSITISNLDRARTHYWRVTAIRTNALTGIQSELRTFYIERFPLAFDLEGPDKLKMNHTGSFLANTFNNVGTTTYAWSYKVGTGSWITINDYDDYVSNTMNSYSGFTIKVTVTDESESVTKTKFVRYDNGGKYGPPGGGDDDF